MSGFQKQARSSATTTMRVALTGVIIPFAEDRQSKDDLSSPVASARSPMQKKSGSNLLYSLCILAGELVALADDAGGSLSQNDNRVYIFGLEPEDGIIHYGKLGVVGGHLDPLIRQELGSQQVQDGVAFAHKLNNGLIFSLLDDL
jgi:hypothetical protein